MNRNKEDKQQRSIGLSNADNPIDFEQAIIKQLIDIANWADDLEEDEMLLKYYYSVDYLFDLLSAWFDEHKDLLEELNKRQPIIYSKEQMNNINKRKETLEYTKFKFRIIMKLLHRENLDKLAKKIYNTDVDYFGLE